jgi:cell division septum initiation protein DivIVA
VALDRQRIEKRDFPVGRRGYDPEAVDAHLSGLADEIDELKRSTRQRSDTLASSASDQVRAIVEAAENSAAEIQQQAESDAAEIRAEADHDVQATREKAAEQAREYVGKVSKSTSGMVERLDAMGSELGSLIESLRSGADRLGADLQLLEGSLAEVSEAVSPRPRFEAAKPEASAQAGSAGPASERATGREPGATPPATELLDDQAAFMVNEEDLAAAGGAADEPGPRNGDTEDVEGARLIALNMALNGTSRQETQRYLTENFSLADPDGLLDEVYASVEG